MKILFYTHTPRAFRTTLIGYLYELCQIHEVVLLAEKLDQETETALKRKDLFPRLSKIITVEQFTGRKRGLLAKNKYFFTLAKEVVLSHMPDVVILASDFHPFELYLARFAKKNGALVITTQAFFSMVDWSETSRIADLSNAHLKLSAMMPLKIRLFLIKCREYFGHFLYYWFLPASNLQKPFLGESSLNLHRGWVGMRDSDCQTVFSKIDYDIYSRIYLKCGVPVEKMFILPHPLQLEAREFFEKIYFSKFKKEKNGRKIASVMLSSQKALGFHKDNLLPIPPLEREKKWSQAIKLMSQILEGWQIYIKPHPSTKNIDHLKEVFEQISSDIKVTDPKEPVDKYIEMADVVVELPPSLGTSLFTALLQCPEKPIISLDLYNELAGDGYKNFPGVEYIDAENKFATVLKEIKEDKYRKNNFSSNNSKSELWPLEFENIEKLIDYLTKKPRKLKSPD